MHSIESMHASPGLQKYVRAYAQRRAAIEDVPQVARVPARLEQILEFQFHDRFEVCFDSGPRIVTPWIAVIGPQIPSRATVLLNGKIDSFAVFFQPAGFSQIFGTPVAALSNFSDEGTAIMGQRVRSLWNELGETHHFEERVRIMEHFLYQCVGQIRVHDRMMETCNQLLTLQGKISVAELAAQARMGVRHFERTFAKRVGFPPKLYARVARFQTALDLKLAAPSRKWTDISHTLGYHDQMHMIHDFKSLGGNSPNRILGNLGDMRPAAVAALAPEDVETGRIFTIEISKSALL